MLTPFRIEDTHATITRAKRRLVPIATKVRTVLTASPGFLSFGDTDAALPGFAQKQIATHISGWTKGPPVSKVTADYHLRADTARETHYAAHGHKAYRQVSLVNKVADYASLPACPTVRGVGSYGGHIPLVIGILQFRL
jgi:hypothetical protein